MRYPLSQGRLMNMIEIHMDGVAKELSLWRATKGKHTPILAETLETQLSGMRSLARRLGIDCDCFQSKALRRPRTVCRCRPMTPSERMEAGLKGTRRL